jgi:hypothetical protein
MLPEVAESTARCRRRKQLHRHRQSRLTIDRSAPPFWQGPAAWRSDEDASESQRVEALSAFVENEHVSGVFEVIDTVED